MRREVGDVRAHHTHPTLADHTHSTQPHRIHPTLPLPAWEPSPLCTLAAAALSLLYRC